MRKMFVASTLFLVLLLNSCAPKEPSERFIIGKGADGAGNTWLIVSSCQDCESERIAVVNLNSYKIGDKLP